MAFVDEHRVVLARRNVLVVHALDDALHIFRHQFVHRPALGTLGQQVVGDQLVAAPFVKVAHMDPVLQPFGLHASGQFDGQRLVVAEHQNRLAARHVHLFLRLGQMLGAVAEDHGLA